jgi:ATP-dependent DNA helicase RecG
MNRTPLSLASPLESLPDVGPKRIEKLSRIGIRSILDLLYFFPFRYEDRRSGTKISNLVPESSRGFVARVRSIRKRPVRNLKVPIVEADLEDDSGMVRAIWFGQEYLLKTLPEGTYAFFFGKAEISAFDGRLSVRSPVVERIDPEKKGQKSFHINRIVPIYHEAEGLGSTFFRKTIGTVLAALWGTDFDPVPRSVLESLEIPAWFPSMVEIHFPKALYGSEDPDSLLKRDYPPRKRFVFEEFFILEFLMGHKKREIRFSPRAKPYRISANAGNRFRESLPFGLTTAQERAFDEILRDLASPHPMNRLLMGDVGSGKTVVAAWGVYLAASSGFQSAFMAPTEILARQHFRTLGTLLSPHGVRTALLTQAVKGSERKALMEASYAGDVDLVVGTHALIQDALSFKNLGFVVVDEQHKFGVEQRKILIAKGDAPDVLVMTATPIPRSLALSYFGDLDVSTLDEKPPGRRPVDTRLLEGAEGEAFWERDIRPAIDRGEQVYVVYPVIDSSSAPELKAATTMRELLAKRWPDIEVGLLTGRMTSDEKEAMMKRFEDGRVSVMVSTTVVEVGVDVPNATVMVVENAERFGLAQLHQLRGRVGRGELPGLFVLIPGNGIGPDGIDRLRILVQSEDGFRIAEEDLRTRGPGEFLGTRQSGLPPFKVADLVRDVSVLEIARRTSQAFLETALEGGSQKSWEWTTLMNFIRNRFPDVSEWLLVR